VTHSKGDFGGSVGLLVVCGCFFVMVAIGLRATTRLHDEAGFFITQLVVPSL
jgi:cell division protein FtsW (lipid II flippase)